MRKQHEWRTRVTLGQVTGAAAAAGHQISPEQPVIALCAVVAGHQSPARVWTVAARPAAVSAWRLSRMRAPPPQFLPCLLYGCD